MASLFLSLVNRSAAAGWLILAVVLLRLLLKRAPKSIRPWLWALVGVRLVWPWFGESPLSLLPSAEAVPQTVLAGDALYVQSGIAAFNNAVNERLANYYETAKVPAGHTQNFVSACALVWIAGMILLLLWMLASYLRLRRQVAEAVPEAEGCWVCSRIDSPFLLGILRPRIYLPADLDGDSRAYVLAHERAHIRRRDYLVKPLGFLLLAVYWFHPLLWLAYILLCRDIELACDERVIAGLGAAYKKPYSTALLQCSVHRSGLAACPLAFGEVGVKERVENVLRYKKPALWVAAASAAALIAVGVCFLTNPVQAKNPNSQPPFYFQGVNQPDEPEVFAAGALLYENMALSYRPVDGGSYSPILYGGDTLTLTCAGEACTYRLEETVLMAWDNLYGYFPTLEEQEAYLGRLLTDHSDLTITARFYRDESGGEAPSVWTVQKENGGGQRWWLYVGGRLFALIYLEEAFPWLASGVLWTFAPDQSTILPIRFDLEGGANIFAGLDGLLSLDPRGEDWTDALTVEQGQTVYWKPPLDVDGLPRRDTWLKYYFDYQLDEDGDSARKSDTLSLRPAMDYTGLYGGTTYGVSSNWLGAVSSQIHFTALDVDGETGSLVVCDTRTFPYALRNSEASVDAVTGKSGPVAVSDAPAETQ